MTTKSRKAIKEGEIMGKVLRHGREGKSRVLEASPETLTETDWFRKKMFTTADAHKLVVTSWYAGHEQGIAEGRELKREESKKEWETLLKLKINEASEKDLLKALEKIDALEVAEQKGYNQALADVEKMSAVVDEGFSRPILTRRIYEIEFQKIKKKTGGNE